MKILMTIFEIMDYGGIVNHVELLARGLQELGHKVDVVMLRAKDVEPKINKPTTEVTGSYKSVVANKVNTITGWYGIQTVGYLGAQRIREWRERAEKYDGIIHQLPVPKPDEFGDWRRLYDLDVPQVAIAHDAHFRWAYPHMIDIADKLRAVSVTNPAGYAALEQYPGARCFIGAPHRLLNWDTQTPWHKREPRFVSAHVWKAWKHMDLVLKAVPGLTKSDVLNTIGGDGIEGRYMRSKDKCKPRYEGLWRNATKGGMNYIGLVSPRRLRDEYRDSRVMVDLSYSKKFAELGNHFNRSTIEAYNTGVVPFCVMENMLDKTRFFRPDMHYVAIRWSKAQDVKHLVERIYNCVHMPKREAERFITNGRAMLTEHFDYRVSAQGFVDLLKGKKKVGIYGKLETGKATKEIKEARNENLRAVTRQT